MDFKEELNIFITPVVRAAKSKYSLLAFAEAVDLGVISDLEAFRTAITNFSDQLGEINQATSQNQTPEQLFDLFIAVDQLFEKLLDLAEGVAGFDPVETINRIFDFLLFSYVRNGYPVAFSALNFVGVWGFYENANGTSIVQNDYKKLDSFLSDYQGWLLNEYGWGGTFKFTHFWDRLFGLNQALGLAISNKQALDPSGYSFPIEELWVYKLPFFQSELSSYDHEKLIPLFTNELGLQILPHGDFNTAGHSGFKIEPYATAALNEEIILSAYEKVELLCNAAISGGLALTVTSEEGLAVSNETNAEANIKLIATLKGEGGEKVNIIPDILSFNERQASLTFDSRTGIEINYTIYGLDITIPFNKIPLLSHLFGPGVNFNTPEIALIWSKEKGLIVKGGTGDSGLDYSINTDLNLGPFSIYKVDLTLFTDEQLNLEVIPSLLVALGPLEIVVEGAGLYTNIEESENGNLGNYLIDFGVRPPTGIGLSLKTPMIKGGGFIKFDDPDYYGIISLELTEVGTVSAIGLISTELPNGEEGYSMLVQIFGEFNPIQIGFGFTLNGVGGLLGVHRTINTDALKATFKSGQLGQLLFPEDPISDAALLIENIKNIFPVEKDSYVFGFMGKFAWGTPVLVDFSVGIMVKLGGPTKIIILGTGTAILPDKTTPLVVLNVDMLGIIDVQEEYLTIEARLFDSRISIFDLKGGMALYASWGSVPDFIMSIGGFHSGYQLTTDRIDVPERIETSLAGENWKLSMQGFFAITTNSLQTGARADLFAEKGNYTAEAGAGFEAIIIFQPFSFEVDIFFYVTIKKKGKIKASCELDVHLRGPNPYNVQGQLAIKVFGIKFRVNFQATFGDKRIEEGLDMVSPAALLKKALEAPEAQEYIRPAWLKYGSKQVPGVSSTENGDLDNSALDMGGEVIVRQSAVPLGISLDHVGHAPIPENQRMLTLAQGRGINSDRIQAKFAADQFFDLSEDHKLSLPAFEDHDAGIKLTSYHDPGSAAVGNESFENIYLDLDPKHKDRYFLGGSEIGLRFDGLYKTDMLAEYDLHENRVGFNFLPDSHYLESHTEAADGTTTSTVLTVVEFSHSVRTTLNTPKLI